MAEALARSCALPAFGRVESAALEGLREVNPEALRSLADAGVPASEQRSKMLDSFSAGDFDVVVSMCGCSATVPDAWKSGKRFEDWNVADPTGRSRDDFDRCRDEITERVNELAASVIEGRPPTYSLYTPSADGVCEIVRARPAAAL